MRFCQVFEFVGRKISVSVLADGQVWGNPLATQVPIGAEDATHQALGERQCASILAAEKPHQIAIKFSLAFIRIKVFLTKQTLLAFQEGYPVAINDFANSCSR